MNPIDRLLSFLPGAKTYIVALIMILTGITQIIDAYLNGALLGPTFHAGLEMVLEGLAAMTLRRGIKTATGDPAPAPGHFYRQPPDPRIMGNPR